MPMNRFLRLLFVTASLLAFQATAEARVFRNSYVSFELPDRWDCVLEQTEYVCRTSNPAIDNREAIIVLTAKEVGPSDALPLYETHLKTPRTIPSRTGQPLQSQIMKVEQRKIANQPWVDGMHLASEVPSYYTRYLATTKDKIAILVTFSAHKLHYTKYSSDFFRAIESLRVVYTRGQLSGGGAGGGGALPGSELLGSVPGGMGYDGESLPDEGTGDDSGLSKNVKNLLGAALLIGAVGLYLLLKRGKKKGRR